MSYQSPEICFAPSSLYTYIFILFSITAISIYVSIHVNDDMSSRQLLEEKIQLLQRELHSLSATEQLCKDKLQITQQQLYSKVGTKKRFYDKIYDPLSPPLNIVPEGSFTEPGYDAYQDFQQTGYISGESGRFPVYSRYHDAGRSDRLEYYTIDDSRGRVKIPFKTKNYSEIFDGDTITLPEMGGETFVFKKYESQGFRYDPNIL